MEINMNKPVSGPTDTIEQEISWTVNFLQSIQDLRIAKEAKLRVINLLVQEEAQISSLKAEPVIR